MRAKHILCTDNSRIFGEDLASKINLFSKIHVCRNKQCKAQAVPEVPVRLRAKKGPAPPP